MNSMDWYTDDKTCLKGNGENPQSVRGVLRLSGRLKAVAGFVRPGSRVADIGTDHGYVPIYLAQTGRAAGAVAMDVRPGPLARAKEHIREYERWAEAREAPAGRGQNQGRGQEQDQGRNQGRGQEQAQAQAQGRGQALGPAFCPIEARLSDGLKELKPGEADTVIMAGMGGELVIRILEQGRHMWGSVRHWILSPQSDIHKVRLYLEEHGFAIEDEAMVKDEGKYYTIMDVVRGEMRYQRPIWYRYGKILLERKDIVLKEYLEKEGRRVRGILEHVNGHGIGEERGAALSEELGWIKEAQDEMQ